MKKYTSFDYSKVTRKEVEAVKKKLRAKQKKRNAMSIAKAELKAEKKEYARKMWLKRLASMTAKQGATVIRKKVRTTKTKKSGYSGLKNIK